MEANRRVMRFAPNLMTEMDNSWTSQRTLLPKSRKRSDRIRRVRISNGHGGKDHS